MGFNHFDYVPSTVNRSRSVFKFDKACGRTAYIGWLYPVCAPIRMQPGSTLSLNLAAEIRSQALVAPLMDEMYCDFYSFFVPNRIVWEHWKQFIGAVDDVLFNNLTEYQIPSFRFGCHNGDVGTGISANTFDHSNSGDSFQWNQTIACHFGLPYVGYTNYGQSKDNKPFINALPFRGYTFIWNMNFRPEQLVAPVVFSKGDIGAAGQNIDALLTPAVATNWLSASVYIPVPSVSLADQVIAAGGSVSDAQRIEVPCLGGAVLPTYRVHRSLWTSCLPNPSLETLNLLGDLSAPVGVVAPTGGVGGSVSMSPYSKPTGIVAGSFGQLLGYNSGASLNEPLIADLSQAMLTVNNYRETIMLQNYYDVLNRAGSRYDEIIRNIFGVQTSNAVTDIPELITHKRFTIYRNQVIGTASGQTSGSGDSVIGQQGAYIDTIVRDSFFTKSTSEHGYIHLLYTIRPARIRECQGIEPEWEELNKFDLYYPQFDGMGDVPRYKREVFYDWAYTSDSQKSVLGYQEYGAVWKYQRNDVAGFLDPNMDVAGLVGYSLVDFESVAPSLVVANNNLLGYVSCFSECCAFSSCLKISTDPYDAPQFILDIRLNGTIAHPMPVYNIPGKGALL